MKASIHGSDSARLVDQPLCVNAPTCGRRPAAPTLLLLRRRRASAFTLVEILAAIGIITIGFLGTFAMVLQGGKLVSAAEEDGLVCTGLEQRMDQLRALSWTNTPSNPPAPNGLTDGTGLIPQVWTSRPQSLSEITVAQETLTVSPYPNPNATQNLQGTWIGTSAPAVTFTGSGPALSTARAVKVVATLTWTGRRSSRPQTRSLVTVISAGGISKSALP